MIKNAWEYIKKRAFGKSKNPLEKNVRKNITLAAFLAWVALGADGLSSLSYGPQQAYLYLNNINYLSIFVGLLIGITIFIISLGYNNIIILFPTGGGSYKVATNLINKYVGVISGVALIIGYTLTITMSITSGVVSLLSIIPYDINKYCLILELFALLTITYLNLRGVKESTYTFVPIFVIFIISHIIIIIIGIYNKYDVLYNNIFVKVITNVKNDKLIYGYNYLIKNLLISFAIGSGTFTGLEAISNNINIISEPKIKNGKTTMLYMIFSLSFFSICLFLLYFLYDVSYVKGNTLNSICYKEITKNYSNTGYILYLLTQISECGILFIGANSGFLGGGSVLANMAQDSWLHKRFTHLSGRLVKKNSIILFSALATFMLLLTNSNISKLLTIYSICVFITFSTSLLGLTIFWFKYNINTLKKKNFFKILTSICGLIISTIILTTLLIYRFYDGGLLTILLLIAVVIFCLLIKKHYLSIEKKQKIIDNIFLNESIINSTNICKRSLNRNLQTAVFFVNKHIGEGIHTVLGVNRIFGSIFRNYVFVSVGIINSDTFDNFNKFDDLKTIMEKRMNVFKKMSNSINMPCKIYIDYCTDHIEKLLELSIKVNNEFKNCIFFASKIILKNETWLTKQLHNETPTNLQKYLHINGINVLIIPILL